MEEAGDLHLGDADFGSDLGLGAVVDETAVEDVPVACWKLFDNWQERVDLVDELVGVAAVARNCPWVRASSVPRGASREVGWKHPWAWSASTSR